MTFTHQFHPSILREYDIRGVVGDTLHATDAYAIGFTFAAMLREELPLPVVAVARDGRLSSPELCDALIDGLRNGGAEVWFAGVGPTPLLYYAAQHFHTDGAIMVTGSHNPPTHNGFKMLYGSLSFFGESIQELGERAAEGVEAGAERGELVDKPVSYTYVERLLEKEPAVERKLTIAWDPGNGAAGAVLPKLIAAMPYHTHVAINMEVDGTFPNHHPDPSVPKNLEQLASLVREHGCDIGLAFDGDGDRLGAVDANGRPIGADQLLMLFAQDVLRHAPHARIIADVKTSQSFFTLVDELGGKPLIWKTGHSHIKKKMKEIDASFAGEASGHIFFADRYLGFDDGLYAAVRLIGLLAGQHHSLAELVAELPQSFASQEHRIDCADDEKFEKIEIIRHTLPRREWELTEIDGIRASNDDGWWLLRASNTQAAIIARCEGINEEARARLERVMMASLAKVGLAP